MKRSTLTMKQMLARVRTLAQEAPPKKEYYDPLGITVARMVGQYSKAGSIEDTYTIWINCDIAQYGISATDVTFELAYLQLKNKIEQWKEAHPSGNTE